MTQLSENLKFEIHVTFTNQTPPNEGQFREICERLGGKSLLIELSKGETPQQLMFSKHVIQNSLEKVLEICRQNSQIFSLNGFSPCRLKIEVDAVNSRLFEKNDKNNYFEWHGKVELKFHDKLRAICLEHDAHLSNNSMQNEENLRFLTMREFGKKSVFDDRVKSLTNVLSQNGWKIFRQISEFCLYDSNISLDKGWLEN